MLLIILTTLLCVTYLIGGAAMVPHICKATDEQVAKRIISQTQARGIEVLCTVFWLPAFFVGCVILAYDKWIA